MIRLENKFIGTGEVKGFEFSKIKENGYAFIYRVNCTNEDGISKYWYEIFEKRISKECNTNIGGVKIHFDEREKYPKSNSFGVWAWTCGDLDRALTIFDSISDNIKTKTKNKQLLT